MTSDWLTGANQSGKRNPTIIDDDVFLEKHHCVFERN